MAIVAGMAWIFIGIFYILYKLGSEECDGGVKGGIFMMLVPIAVFAIFYLPVIFDELIGGMAGPIAMATEAVLFALWLFKPNKKKSEQVEAQKKQDAQENIVQSSSEKEEP